MGIVDSACTNSGAVGAGCNHALGDVEWFGQLGLPKSDDRVLLAHESLTFGVSFRLAWSSAVRDHDTVASRHLGPMQQVAAICQQASWGKTTPLRMLLNCFAY